MHITDALRANPVSSAIMVHSYLLPQFCWYNHHTKERRVGVKYYIGGHRAMTDVSPTSQAVRCKTPTSNGEASG